MADKYKPIAGEPGYGTKYSGVYTYGTTSQQVQQAKAELQSAGRTSLNAPPEIVKEAQKQLEQTQAPKTIEQQTPLAKLAGEQQTPLAKLAGQIKSKGAEIVKKYESFFPKTATGSEVLELKPQFQSLKLVEPTARSLAFFGAGALAGIKGAPRGLYETAASFRRNPIEALKQMDISTRESFAANPAYTSGSFAGQSLFFKGLGVGAGKVSEVRFIGKKFVEPEKLIEPKILAGKETFPSTRAGATTLIKEFKSEKFKLPESEKPSGFHTTAERGFGKEVITKGGSSESPGLFISPSLSPHFMRLGGKLVYPGESRPLVGLGINFPKALSISVKDVTRIPREYRGGLAKGAKFLTEKASKEKAYISPAFELGKTEKEAIIPPEARLERTTGGYFGFKYYSKFAGKKFPIYEFKTAGKGAKETIKAGELAKLKSPLEELRKEPYVKVGETPKSLFKSSEKSPLSSLKSSVGSSLISSKTSSVSRPSTGSSLISTTSYPLSRPPSSPLSSLISHPSRPSSYPPSSPRKTTIFNPPSPPLSKLFLSEKVKPKTKLFKRTFKRKIKYEPSIVGIFSKKKFKRFKTSLGIEVRPVIKRR